MTPQRIVLHRNVGDGTPPVVAGHISDVEEQVGLDREILATGQPHRFRLGFPDDRCQRHRVWRSHRHGFHPLHLCRILEERHHPGSPEGRIIVVQEALPQPSAVVGLQHLLQLFRLIHRQVLAAFQLLRLILWQILVAPTLHEAIVLVAGILHQIAEVTVVLKAGLHIEMTRVEGHEQMVVEEAEQIVGTSLAQIFVVPGITFRRGGTTNHQAHQLQPILIGQRQHLVLQPQQQRIVLGQRKLVDGEDHLSGHLIEFAVSEHRPFTFSH